MRTGAVLRVDSVFQLCFNCRLSLMIDFLDTVLRVDAFSLDFNCRFSSMIDLDTVLRVDAFYSALTAPWYQCLIYQLMHN